MKSAAPSMITVISVDDVIESSVSERLLSWHSLGLLHAFMLIDARGGTHAGSPIKTHDHENPIAALGRAGAVEVTLLNVCGPGGPTAPVDEFANTVLRSAADPTKVIETCIYSTGASDGPLGGPYARPRAHHLILSNEDRTDAKAINAGVDTATTPDRLAFVAAVAAGLFAGQHGDASIRAIPPSPTLDYRYARAFGRLAVSDGDCFREIHRAVDRIRTDGGAMARFAGGTDAPDPAGLTRSIAGTFHAQAGDGALRYRQYNRQKPPRPRRITFLLALKMFKDYCLELIRSTIKDAVRDAAVGTIKRLEDRAQKMIFGTGSAYKIELVPGLDSDQPVVPELLADQLLQRDDQSIQIAATPKLWRQLRDTAVGIMDCSELPDFVQLPVLNNIPMLVTDARFIAPLPAASTRTSTEEGGNNVPDRACDPRDPLLSTTNAKHGDKSVSDDSAAETHERLNHWLAKRRHSFTWNVASLTAGSLSGAEAQLLSLHAKLIARFGPETHPDEAEQVADASRRRRRTLGWILFAAALLIALVAPIIGVALGLISVLVMAVIEFFVVTTAVITGLWRYWKWLRRRFQEAHRLQVEAHELEQDINAMLHSAQEVLRLQSIYFQLIEWSDVLAHIAHQPYGSTELAPSESVLSQIGGPVSLVKGRAVVSDVAHDKVVNSIGKAVYGKGWLRSVLLRRCAEISAREREVAGDEAMGEYLEADYDVGAIRGLAAALDKQLRRLAAQESFDELVRREIVSTDRTTLFTGVEYNDREMSLEAFFAACASPSDGDASLLTEVPNALDPRFEHAARVDPECSKWFDASQAEFRSMLPIGDELVAPAYRLDVGYPLHEEELAEMFGRAVSPQKKRTDGPPPPPV